MRPELIEQPDLMQTKLILRLAPLGQNVIKDVIKTLNERQKEIVKILAIEPICTTDEISRRLFVIWRTILRDIKKLQDLEILKREGGRSDGRWIVIKR